jgi:hypothetical protein
MPALTSIEVPSTKGKPSTAKPKPIQPPKRNAPKKAKPAATPRPKK